MMRFAVKNSASPAARAVGERFTPQRLLRVMGGAVKRTLVTHLRTRDARVATKLAGMPRRHFFRKAAAATKMVVYGYANPPSARIASTGGAGNLLNFVATQGGPLGPRRGQRLAIPLTPRAARAKTPKRWKGARLVRIKQVLATVTGRGGVHRITPQFALVKAVRVPRQSDAVPATPILQQAARAAAERLYARAQQAGVNATASLSFSEGPRS